LADNVAITAGSGTTIGADDVGGVLIQRVKTTWGPDGTANDADVATGKPLPTQIRSATGLIPIGEPTEAKSTATDTTSASLIAISKQISASVQALAALITADGLNVFLDPQGVNANGRAAAASSAPVVLSNEDKVALADDAAFTPGTSNVNMAGFQADETATDSVDEGDAGAARMTLDRKQIMTLQPHTAGGLSVFRSLDLDETEEDVKTSAGCLYKLRITNRTTSIRYVKLYNDTAANVIVGTTAPLDTIPVPAGGSADLATVITENFGGVGLTFSAALSMAATTGFADNDTGAPGANDIIVSAYYK
jgi:hypothetical protein